MIRTVKLGECLASIAGQAVLVQRGLSGRFQTALLREVYVKLEGDGVTHPHPPRLRALAVGDMLPLVWAYYLQHIAMRSLPITEVCAGMSSKHACLRHDHWRTVLPTVVACQHVCCMNQRKP